MKIHLIDGTYELFRNFYAVPSTFGPDGQEVGATRGLVRSLTAMLREKDVTHVGIAFDHIIESFRNDLFDGYKTGEGIDPALFSQFTLAEEACRALGLVVWPMIEFEADDMLASAAEKWSAHPSVDQILLCSRDKDLAQCIRGTRVVMLDRMNHKIMDEAYVIEKWSVPPTSIPDYLALVGDSADGIPGIPGWGARSTAQVLAAYGRLESIPANETEWKIHPRGAKKLAENLAKMSEQAALYKQLATLRTDVEVPQEITDLHWRGADAALMSKLCQRLGESSIHERVQLKETGGAR